LRAALSASFLATSGGILASAHLATDAFVRIHEGMAKNDHQGAGRIWSRLEQLVPLMFREANPMPIKYCLWSQGLLRSAECRLPLTQVSQSLAAALDQALGELDDASTLGGASP
jgi:4-hydroxy-tetrahydrodipicolinate synthase